MFFYLLKFLLDIYTTLDSNMTMAVGTYPYSQGTLVEKKYRQWSLDHGMFCLARLYTNQKIMIPTIHQSTLLFIIKSSKNMYLQDVFSMKVFTTKEVIIRTMMFCCITHEIVRVMG
jgi:hypothetical protein